MIEIAVGSQNPTKLNAVRLAFAECLDEPTSITGYSIGSGVSEQPMTDEETISGAQNRAYGLACDLEDAGKTAKYVVGIEGGMRIVHDTWFEVGWVCLLDTAEIWPGLGGTPALRIPQAVRNLMERENLEESEAIAAIYGTDTTTSRDCSSIISGGLITAERNYSLGVLAAFGNLRSNSLLKRETS